MCELKYRNLFVETGKTRKEVSKKLEEIWSVFFYGREEERLYYPVGRDMGYIEDTGNHDVRTEGMSYGMMICVQMDRRRMERNILPWHYCLLLTGGETEKESTTIPFRHRKY